MNKKLSKLLRPSVGLFFALLMVFAGAALYLQYYILAIVEFSVIAVALAAYLIYWNSRRKYLQKYLHKALENVTAAEGSQPPFPMVALRMEDNTVIYANDAFTKLTGFSDYMAERTVDTVIPGFTTDWLSSGKTQYPFDVTLQQRRYRVYGTTLYANDPKSTRLGVLYFTDLTELYQVRDEYIRSRPVVSIILVDNYEELTKNLTEGATSALHAQINGTITKWAEQYGGLLRRLERNRFLLVFEKRDMKHVIDHKFDLLEQIHEITSPSGLPASISIGMGVDANIITAERIKEEIQFGKTIDGAIYTGSKNSFWAIFDGNITVLIVSIVLMGVFGPPSSFWSTILTPFLFMFPTSTTGMVYSFGYTLFIGVVLNFIMGVALSRLMLRSISRIKFLRNPWLYGGERV